MNGQFVASSDERGVSAVVAIVLLVAIVVALGGIAGIYLTQLTDDSVTTPEVEFEFEYEGECIGDDDLRVVHAGGVDLQPARVDAVMNGTRYSFAAIGQTGPMTAGDSVTLNATGSTQYASDMWGQTVRVVWNHPNDRKTVVLASFELPDNCDPVFWP